MIRPILFLLAILTATLTASAADLAVTLAPSALAYTSGNQGTFTTTVRNFGPDAADAAVQVQFTAFSGNIDATSIQLVSKPADFTCGAQFETAQGHTFSCTATAIASGYEGQIVYTATITGTSGNMRVRSTIFAPDNDPDGSNNGSEAMITVAPPAPAVADLSVTLTPSATSFVTGSTGTFTTTIRSAGPDTVPVAANIQFTALSGNINATNITVVSKPAEFTCGAQFETAQGHNIPCTAASIPAGYEGSIVLSATITGTSGNMDVTGSASTAGDPNTSNNFSVARVTVAPPQADLALTITSPTPPAVPSGSTATYVVDFENDGPDAAANPVVSFRFTSLNGTIGVTNIQVVSTPPGFSCGAPVATAQGPTVSCTTSSFASGATGSITFTGEVTGSSGQMEVCANISSPTTGDPDTNGQLNSGCVLNTVTAPDPDPTTSIACPGAFVSGNSGQGTVTISIAQTSDTTIALASSNTAVATVPATVVILAGQTSAPFTITGVGPGTSTITATPPAGFGTAQTCEVTVNPAAASPVISLGNGNCPAAPIGPGTNAMATISISPAQGTNTVISLQSSNPSVATVPPTVTILAGQTSATFVITGVSAGSTTITATLPDALGGDTATCTTVVIARAEGVESIPTLSPAVLGVLALLLAGVALFVTRS